MPIKRLAARIKRRQTPIDRALYGLARRAQRFEIPAPKAVYGPLEAAWRLRGQATDAVRRTVLFQPMFRARCASVGPGLLMYGGYPYLHGDLQLHIGAQCKIHGRTAFAGGSLFDKPELRLGDHTNLGFGVVISVARSVVLGSHVRVADGCYIADNPGHPLDPVARRDRGVTPDQVKPVVIEDDVWLGNRVTVMPGVTIGRGAIVGAGSVVTKDVPPMCIAAGVPARVVRRLEPTALRRVA